MACSFKGNLCLFGVLPRIVAAVLGSKSTGMHDKVGFFWHRGHEVELFEYFSFRMVIVQFAHGNSSVCAC